MNLGLETAVANHLFTISATD